MNFIADYFSLTTAQEQDNYFSGDNQKTMIQNKFLELPNGNYRVIDGKLCNIITDLSPRDIRQRINEIMQKKEDAVL